MKMVEEIFRKILNSKNGDYIIQAQTFADMKPSGWKNIPLNNQDNLPIDISVEASINIILLY